MKLLLRLVDPSTGLSYVLRIEGHLEPIPNEGKPVPKGIYQQVELVALEDEGGLDFVGEPDYKSELTGDELVHQVDAELGQVGRDEGGAPTPGVPGTATAPPATEPEPKKKDKGKKK